MVRIAVAGGTGLAGRHTVAALRQAGHDAVVLARSVGVDLASGDGLAAALVGPMPSSMPATSRAPALSRHGRSSPPPPADRTQRRFAVRAAIRHETVSLRSPAWPRVIATAGGQVAATPSMKGCR